MAGGHVRRLDVNTPLGIRSVSISEDRKVIYITTDYQ